MRATGFAKLVAIGLVEPLAGYTAVVSTLRAEDGTTYELRPLQRVLSLVMLPLFVLAGTFVLVGNLREGFVPGIVFTVVWLVFAAYQGWYALRRIPTAVVVGDDALQLVARSRTIVVPWTDLRSVRSPIWDLNRQMWVWRWRAGKVRSWAQFRDAHRLLNDIEQHAPQAEIAA